jgi:hypothetical protein
MKATLFFLFGFISFAQAQSIAAYYGQIAGATETEGINHRGYVVVSSATPIDQSPSGVNATWTFNQLSAIGPSVYTNATPTASEVAMYPGTTMVTTNINSAGIVQTVSKLYSVMNQAFTGASSEASGFNLNYTDNATIGTFPLAFNYSNTDAVAGTYSYTTYSGTFSGSVVSSIDAYGTLTTNNYGFGENEIPVTRLKIVQALNLDYNIFTNVGTAIVTSYHYYYGNELFPFFTSATTSIDVPLLSINQTTSLLEAAGPQLLATPQFDPQNAVSVSPNPVRDYLMINADAFLGVVSVSVLDMNGRVVIDNASSNAPVNISHLAKGVYFAKIDLGSATITKKIIKE